MASLKEIVTKAVIGKAKKKTTTDLSFTSGEKIDKILGCWIINHHFEGENDNGKVTISGSYDVNIWYSYDNNTKTSVIVKTFSYDDELNIKLKNPSNASDIIVRALTAPNVSKAEAVGTTVNLKVEKEMGAEIVGDAKVRVSVEEDYDDYDEYSNYDDDYGIGNYEVKDDMSDPNYFVRKVNSQFYEITLNDVGDERISVTV